MLLDFSLVNGETVSLDPIEVESVKTASVTVAHALRPVAQIAMSGGDKHIVLDDGRTVSKRIHEARLTLMGLSGTEGK